MATKDEIKKTILKVAGNPATGVIVELADALADAIEALDKPAREVRIVESKETR